MGETPGPIPNPEAKTHSADGTAPERVWESRTPPDNHYGSGPTPQVWGLTHLNHPTPTPHQKGPDAGPGRSRKAAVPGTLAGGNRKETRGTAGIPG